MRSAAARPTVPLRGSPFLNATILIEPRYCGPADRANGGYVAGVLAGFFETPFELTFRRPVPLSRPLQVTKPRPDALRVLEGEEVLAEARATELQLDVPPPPGPEEAARATRDYLGYVDHPFPRCFVCGVQRAEADGLRIHAGPVPGRSLVAAPWSPHPVFADPSTGQVRPEIIWAALDCPGAFAALLGREPVPVVLGRIAARVERVPGARERCVVYAWPIAHDGRKHQVGTAIADDEGRVIAYARATWIDVAQRDSAS